MYDPHIGRSSGRSTPQLTIDPLNTTTPKVADLPPPIDHRPLEYHYPLDLPVHLNVIFNISTVRVLL